MNDAFVLKGRLELDTTDFDDELDAARDKAKGFEDSVQKGTGSASSMLKNALSVAGGQLLSRFAEEAWDAVKQFAKESITVASNLEEVQNVVDVTFGDGAAEINVWAKNALEAFGMSEYSAKKYSSTMGAMFKSFGMTNDAAQDMSQGVVSLAADMASFYNMDHEEIMTKIRAGFAGEIEPLRQLGINMSVANLEAYALAKGMDKAYSSMTQAEQAQLRYNYLLDATSDSQGDFLRTSGNYANQKKILEGHLEEISAAFGASLINAVTPAITQLNEWLDDWTKDNPLEQIKKETEEEQFDINARYGVSESIIGDMGRMIDELGDAAYETDEWRTATKALVQTMPELGEYIDQNTGRLTVSTEELLKNAQAIRDVKLAASAQKAVDSYNTVVDQAWDALVKNQVDLYSTQQWIKELLPPLEEVATALGTDIKTAWNAIMYEGMTNFGLTQAEIQKIEQSEAYKTLKGSWSMFGGTVDGTADKIGELWQQEAELIDQQEDLVDQYEKSQEAAEKGLEAAKALVNANTTSADATNQFSSALEAERAAMVSAGEAAKKLKEYYDGLKGSAHDALDSVFKFLGNGITFEAVDLVKIGENIDIDNTTLSLYAKNLAEAKNEGMDANMLAYLADGSVENMAILDAWINGGDDIRKTFTDQFTGYTNAKEAAATAMADAQAAVDKEYQALEDELEAMANAFNQADGVTAAIDTTEVAASEGLQSMYTVVKDGVQAINDVLAGLPTDVRMNFTVSSNIGGDSGDNATPNAKGLGYVPYDNYLTRLHKGESVLNRVEAENWRKGANNAPAGIDYDRLAAVLAANMAGMSMQMDGKMIGALIAPVVSRNIEKEAWRGRY